MLIVAPDDWIRPVTAVDTHMPSSGLSIFVSRLRNPLCDLMNLGRRRKDASVRKGEMLGTAAIFSISAPPRSCVSPEC